ncbi:MAG TPA: hypothetical protein VMH03_06870, partial [Terriglobales bacterium]|nr:hypothetical protein [Terriglobales bacterium]
LAVFAVHLHRQTGGGRFREQEALRGIDERIAVVPAWIAADPVRRLDATKVAGCGERVFCSRSDEKCPSTETRRAR